MSTNKLMNAVKKGRYTLLYDNFIYKFCDRIENQLSKISSFEKESEFMNKELTENYRQSKAKFEDLSFKIRTLGSKNKKLIDKYKDLKSVYNDLNTKMENKLENNNETKNLEMKQAIKNLKTEIKNMDVKSKILSDCLTKYYKKNNSKYKNQENLNVSKKLFDPEVSMKFFDELKLLEEEACSVDSLEKLEELNP